MGTYRATRTLEAVTASRANGDNANADSASSNPLNGIPESQDLALIPDDDWKGDFYR